MEAKALETEEPARLRASALLPWLLLLPPGLLALPGFLSPIAGDPFPQLTGIALVACAVLPTALWIAIAGSPRTRGLWILLLLFGIAAAQALLLELPDPAEARLRVVSLGSALVLFIGGASLDPLGRRSFNRGLVVLSFLWTGAAWISARAFGEEHLAGVLGNTGLLSQAALPGAAIGAWYVATRSGGLRVLGALAFALFLVHAFGSPVLAGSGSLLGVLVFSAILSPWARGRAKVRKRLGLMAAVVAFAMAALLGGSDATSPAPESETRAPSSDAEAELATDPGDLGGVGVRLGIWSQLPEVLREFPGLGFGPGQFEARFPPFRSVEEMERSRGGACGRGDTEVDHPHSDWLFGFFEFGLPGGLLLLTLLAIALRRSIVTLQDTDFATIALGAGGLALLLFGISHGPLFINPAAGSIGWVIFGCLLVLRPEELEGRNLTPARWISLPIGVIALLGAGIAWPHIPHGRALAAHGRALEIGDRALASAALTRALERVPDSAPALRLAAHGGLQRDDGASSGTAAWDRVLAVRPWSVEALSNGGLAHLKAGRVDEARRLWQRALELAPTHPRLIENLGRLEVLEGTTHDAREWALRLSASPCASSPWLIQLGAETARLGRWSVAAPLLFGGRLEALVPEEIFARAGEAPYASIELGTRSARALAHVLWAREQVETKEFETAVRSFRQASSATRGGEAAPEAAPTASLELAAILFLAGRDTEARSHLEGRAAPRSPEFFEELPNWAGTVLREHGVVPGE